VQADAFAGANAEEKASACSVRNDGRRADKWRRRKVSEVKTPPATGEDAALKGPRYKAGARNIAPLHNEKLKMRPKGRPYDRKAAR